MPDGPEWLSSSGRKLAIDDIIAELHSQNCIVQPVLEDCAELRTLGTEALSSVRLVTAKGDSIGAQPIAASLSLATESGSPISHHGTMCGVDISMGTVIKVKPRSEHHDMERDRLLGFVLPFWAQTVSLVCRAHQRAFPAFVTLGWDVALTQNGPILLETNVSWNMAQHQLRTGPLGKTGLANVIDELLGPAKAR
jgi:hypothetical protein